jgi:hypothetical protein
LAQSLRGTGYSNYSRIAVFLRKTIFAVAAAMLHFSAQASLISPLEYNDGGHTWLKLSETVGISIDDFRSGAGGWRTKYRLATSDEIEGLLTSFGIAKGDSGYRTTGTGAGAFVHTFGGYIPGSMYDGTWGFNGNQGAIGVGLGWFVSAELTEEGPAGPYCPQYFSCQRTIAVRGASYFNPSSTGLFLVQSERPHQVPEPTGIALMGLAGGLLAYQRRKKNK